MVDRGRCNRPAGPSILPNRATGPGIMANLSAASAVGRGGIASLTHPVTPEKAVTAQLLSLRLGVTKTDLPLATVRTVNWPLMLLLLLSRIICSLDALGGGSGLSRSVPALLSLRLIRRSRSINLWAPRLSHRRRSVCSGAAVDT